MIRSRSSSCLVAAPVGSTLANARRRCARTPSRVPNMLAGDGALGRWPNYQHSRDELTADFGIPFDSLSSTDALVRSVKMIEAISLILGLFCETVKTRPGTRRIRH